MLFLVLNASNLLMLLLTEYANTLGNSFYTATTAISTPPTTTTTTTTTTVINLICKYSHEPIYPPTQVFA